MAAQDTRFIGTFGGALVDMEFGYPSDEFFRQWINGGVEEIFARNSPEAGAADKPTIDIGTNTLTQTSLNDSSDTYDDLVSNFDDIESDLNDEFEGTELELAQEHLDLAFAALNEVRIHMARFERLLFPPDAESDSTDAHDLSD